MTDTPHIEALAMRTRAAAVCNELAFDKRASAAKYRSGSNPNWERTHDAIIYETSASAILALPLEADPAALVAEALRLPEIAALVEAANKALPVLGEYEPHPLSALSRLLTALTALEQP